MLATLPQDRGGLDASVIYIDTEAAFSATRLDHKDISKFTTIIFIPMKMIALKKLSILHCKFSHIQNTVSAKESNLKTLQFVQNRYFAAPGKILTTPTEGHFVRGVGGGSPKPKHWNCHRAGEDRFKPKNLLCY